MRQLSFSRSCFVILVLLGALLAGCGPKTTTVGVDGDSTDGTKSPYGDRHRAPLKATDLVPTEVDGVWGFADPDGFMIIEPKYAMAYEFSEGGITSVLGDDGWAVINMKGEVLVRPFIYDNGPDYFEEGLARYVDEQGKFGFFDLYGQIAVPAAFDFAAPFVEQRAAVCNGCVRVQVGEHWTMKGGKWGYIDVKGDVVIPLEYDEANDFVEGKAMVKKGGVSVEIDKGGK